MKFKGALDTVSQLAKLQIGQQISTFKSPWIKKHFIGSIFAEAKAEDLTYEALDVPGQAPVPQLANKLDRVLFSPGVHFLKDPRTNVYNFDSRLEQIMSIADFDFRRIASYVPAGRDSKLSSLAGEIGKKYTASTSSLTPVLMQLHHALSHNRPPQILNLPKYFPGNLSSFSAAQRAPVNMWLVNCPSSNTHAISMAGESQEFILTLLGQTMETMLVTECGEFEKWSKSHPSATSAVHDELSSTYNYTTCDSFLMRSQLDCYDPRLPGTGMFDLKTRACCAVRYDIDYAQINDGSDYQILKNSGHFESFSREYYELVRSAMFKYSLQARIGRMDGIFLAYHSVRRLFGFEYLPLHEIDKIFHTAQLVPANQSIRLPSSIKDAMDLETKLSSVATHIAECEFKLSISLLGKLLDTLRAHILNSSDGPKDLNFAVHCNAPGQLVVFARAAKYGDKTEPTLLGRDSVVELPPDLHGFRVTFVQFINDKIVPTSKYPSLRSESDSWRVTAEIQILASADLKGRFKETQEQHVFQDLISNPRTSSPLNEEESKDLLAKLPDATKLQTLLRQLDKKGSEYAEWDEMRPKIDL